MVWIPFINGLSTEVHQTKRLLMIIPIEYLMNLKNVASLLNQEKISNIRVKGVGTQSISDTKKSTSVTPD
jgi:hypothetical protein